MQIDRINTLEQFVNIRTDWDRVYCTDRHAHIFMSWVWLQGWLRVSPFSWFILCARTSAQSPYVAFLPITERGPHVLKFQPARLLTMGGQPLASYTGFICEPNWEKEALPEFARYLAKNLNWLRFHMAEVLDPRLQLFLNAFPSERFIVHTTRGMPALHVSLSDDWESYLSEKISKNTRKKLRRSLKEIQLLPGIRVTEIDASNAARDIDLQLTLWQKRWGPKPLAGYIRQVLLHLHQHDQLRLSIFWDGENPIAASTALLDWPHKRMYGYIFGGNSQYTSLSPGKVTLGHEIQFAIAHGFEDYDFLLGNDPYKLSFGAQLRKTTNVKILPKGFSNNIANASIDLFLFAFGQLKSLFGKAKRTKLVMRFWIMLVRFRNR